MFFSLVSYAISRRRRDFTSVMQIIATSYSVMVDPESIGKARSILGVNPSSTPSEAVVRHDTQTESRPEK